MSRWNTEDALRLGPGLMTCLFLAACSIPAGSAVAPAPAETDAAARSGGQALPAGSEQTATPASDATLDPTPGDAEEPGDAVVTRTRNDVGCRPDPGAAMPVDYWEPGPHDVGTRELRFEDPSRPIEANAYHEAAPSRVLNTRVYYPAEVSSWPSLGQPEPAQQGRPFPMLMYSHGFSSSRDEANKVGAHLASHGYLVVAPDFPLSNMTANGGEPDVRDVSNQPGDVRFLIDALLDLSATQGDPLEGTVDSARIGALGVSLGGLTTLLLGFHAEKMDPRIVAVAPIAAPSLFLQRAFFDTRDIPLLLLHGDNDAFIDYALNPRQTLERAAPSVRLLTVARGSHAGFGLPVDAWLLGLVSPLYAPADAHPDNPDGLGCGFVASNIASTGPEFMEGLGGEEVGISVTEQEQEAALPCTGPEYTREALDPDEQMRVLATGVAAFFESVFAPSPGGRAGACRFLHEGLPEHQAVQIE